VASPDSALSHLVACRLAYGCTDLTADYPHGGTALGLTSSVYVDPPASYRPVVREEDNAIDAVVFVGGPLIVGFRLEGWDNDALAVLFPSSTTVSGDRVLQWPGSGTQPGVAVSHLSKVVVSPFDPTKPGVILYSAAPVVQLNEGLRLQAKSFLHVPVILLATPDGSGRLGAMGKFSRLSGLLA
jgi:hypothetical protein